MKTPPFKTLALTGALLVNFGIARADYKTYDEALVAARALFQKGDHEGAQRELEAGLPLVKTNEDKFLAIIKIGETYRKRKLYPQAREQWEKALQVPDILVDNRVAARLLIAESYSDNSNWDAARTEFQNILDTPGIELNSEYAARLGLFTTYANLEQPEAVAKARDEIYAILNDPQFSSSNKAKAAIFYGDSLNGKKKFDDARAAYSEDENINGVLPLLRLQALIKIADSYEKEGKLADADNAYSAAFTFGLTEGARLTKADKFEESNAVLRLSLTVGRIAPAEKASTFLFIGGNFMGLKQWEDALASLQEAAKEPDAAKIGQLTPQRLGQLRRFQTEARIRMARIFIAGDQKEWAKTALTELLDNPDFVFETDERAQLEQMLKSVS